MSYKKYLSSCSYSVTHEDASKLLRYEPETGGLFWRIPVRHGQVPAGTEVGYIHTNTGVKCRKQYRFIKIGKEKYLAHHLAWLLHYGKWLGDLDPNLEIDHKDGDGTNNSISNLRGVTRQQNIKNRAI